MDAFGEAGTAEGSGDDLVVTGTRSEEISKFTVLSAEAVGGVMPLEAAQPSDPAFDAAMVLSLQQARRRILQLVNLGGLNGGQQPARFVGSAAATNGGEVNYLPRHELKTLT